mgnify:FL=1
MDDLLASLGTALGPESSDGEGSHHLTTTAEAHAILRNLHMELAQGQVGDLRL